MEGAKLTAMGTAASMTGPRTYWLPLDQLSAPPSILCWGNSSYRRIRRTPFLLCVKCLFLIRLFLSAALPGASLHLSFLCAVSRRLTLPPLHYSFMLATQWWENDPHSYFYRGPHTCANGTNYYETITTDRPQGDLSCTCDLHSTCDPALGTDIDKCLQSCANPPLRPWSQIASDVKEAGNGYVFVIVAFGLCVSKMIDRVSKFYIVALQGAFFFALLDTFRRLAVAIVAIFALNEAASPSKFIALFLAVMAIFLHSYAKQQVAIRKVGCSFFHCGTQPCSTCASRNVVR